LLHPQVFLKLFEFTDDHERQYVRQLSKRAITNKIRMYMLTDEARITFGFVALSVGSISGIPPCIIIDYLFTSMPYRKMTFTELNGLRISKYLIGSALQIAQQVNAHIPIHYLALQPAHEKLERYYADLGFTRLHHKEWMFLKI